MTTVLGREPQLAVIDEVLTRDVPGHLALTGYAGMGKTTLLRSAANRASALGYRVVRAHAHVLERDYAFGVVRQLFQPVIALLSPAAREDLLSGERKLAAAVLWPDGEITVQPGGDAADVLQAVCEVAVFLAQQQPLALVVDDLQWIDDASCQWLDLLVRTVKNAPVIVIAARTTGVPGDARVDEFIGRLGIVDVPGLAESDVLLLGQQVIGAEPDPGVVAVCHEATGGNPFLLRMMLSGRVLQAGAKGVADWVVKQIRRADVPHCSEVATAVAVLGESAELSTIAGLTGLDPGVAGRSIDILGRMGLLCTESAPQFIHSIVRDAVYETIPTGKLRLLNAAAARVLHDHGAVPEHVSAHLLACDFIGESWVTETLRAAAEEALGRGVAEASARYLRRALEERLKGVVRLQVLAGLGRAELAFDLDLAVVHLTEVFAALREPSGEETLDPVFVAQVLADLALARSAGRPSCSVLDQVTADLAGRAPELSVAVEGLMITASLGDPDFPWAQRLERLQQMAAGYPELEIFADVLTGFFEMSTARSLTEAAAQAMRVRDLGDVPSTLNMMAHLYAVIVTTNAEMTDEAERYCEILAASGSSTGQPLFVEYAYALRGGVMLHTGRLTDAVRLVRQAVAIRDATTPGRALTVGWEEHLLVALLARGDVGEAAELVGSWGLEENWTPIRYEHAWLMSGRGLLRAEQGDFAGAFADQMAAGQVADDHSLVNPSMLPWRGRAALAADRLGKSIEAKRLAAEDVTYARQWGSRRALGRALIILGRVSRDIESLAEAANVLALSADQVSFAAASFHLGVAHHSARRSGDARAALTTAYDLATAGGAARLAEQAERLINRIDARHSGPQHDILTAQERQIAERAAGGMSNREIADELFVTVRTVEHHLTAVYRKLGINGRRSLSDVLC